TSLPFWLAVAGVALAWFFYLKAPAIPAALKQRLAPLYRLLENKYYMDWINEHVIAAAARALGTGLWKGGDQAVIDGAVVNGSARLTGAVSSVVRLLQTGYLYWYAFFMIAGLLGLMSYFLMPSLFRG
ncbi:MAG: NADH-quinone oxidoreductase subunit L, partial [Betaproteobacteria bacterium]|nr:NADH-quinone oxidoreductase subunit L [Betaproteobacteria bacterium]